MFIECQAASTLRNTVLTAVNGQLFISDRLSDNVSSHIPLTIQSTGGRLCSRSYGRWPILSIEIT